ncbi:wd40 repeat-containing protein [Leptolyngbya sp. Heron Island J]|uniref:WD40 domain-containing protein n=1 Tax=Leptolyngbya sp. Heron Island J TaxID=1385935 RepID=UPI0003B95E0A|nr:DnaJ domain-containing protein [Leptolyngbya sp. Heron Island J]ESA34935.1 wd40 repeat-containing protein [Leptolyngbya sp. Heron Island J]
MASLNYYYGVLCLEPGSTKEDIKRAYRKLAQQWHPDKFSNQPEQLQQAREKFELIKEAYDTLIQLSEPTNFGTRISVRPPSAEEHYEIGIAYLQTGKHKQAIESFTQAIRKRPHYLQAYQARAFTLEQLGLDLQAKADFKKVAELKRHTPSSVDNSLTEAEMVFQQGLAQFKARKYGAAIEHFTTVIQLNPNHIDAYRYRSQAYFRRGYDDRADADFRRMRDLEQRTSAPRQSSAQVRSRSPRWQCLHTLSRHTAVVSAVALTRDGKKLVTGSYDQTLRIWSVKTGSLLRTLSDHSKEIYCIAISGDGKLIASGGTDRTIQLWDLRTGDLVRSLGNLILGHADTVTALAFSPNNQFLVSTSQDKTVRLWSLKSGKEGYTLKDNPAAILALAMSWDGKSFVYGGKGNLLSLRHTKTGKVIRSFSANPTRAVALSRQGSLLAVGSGAEIVMWNRQYQKKLFELRGHAETVSSLAFSADGQILVSGSYDHTVKIWHVSTGKIIDTLVGHQAGVYSVAYSLDGKLIVSGSADHTVKVWQLS